MRVLLAMAIGILVVACGKEGAPTAVKREPAVSVKASVSVRQGASSGCSITWTAVASNPDVEVHYSVGLRGYSGGVQGEFRDSTDVVWPWAGPFPVDVSWVMSAGTWSQSKSVGVNGC